MRLDYLLSNDFPFSVGGNNSDCSDIKQSIFNWYILFDKSLKRRFKKNKTDMSDECSNDLVELIEFLYILELGYPEHMIPE